jgi:hypothetical protein
VAVVVGVAVIGIVICYATGLPHIGGALLLSGILVSTLVFVRSGALSAAWLQNQDKITAARSIYLELAKALISAALGIDFVIGVRFGMQQGVVPAGLETTAIFLTVVALTILGAGIFLLRFLGVLLFVNRR